MGSVWRHLDRPETGLLNELSYRILGAELSAPGSLSSLRSGPQLLVASDYSTGRVDGHFECMSFLVVDGRSLGQWNVARADVRCAWLADGRRMAYKALGDARRAGALQPFLFAADLVRGVVVTTVLDRRMVRDACEFEPGPHPCGADFSGWKVPVLARMAMIGKIGALLIAGLAADGQDVLWITDDDEVVANEDRLRAATKFLGHYINHLSPITLGHIRFGTTRSDDGNLALEDLAGIADLAAGALADIANEELHLDHLPDRDLKAPLSENARAKTRVIASWLAAPSSSLGKLAVYADGVPGGYRCGVVTLDNEARDPRLIVA